MRVRLSLVAGILFAAAAALGAAVTTLSAPARAIDLVRTRLTACPLPGLRCAPLGVFLHQRAIGAALDSAFGAVDPNILVSSAWIDVAHGPTRLTIPSFGQRFFAIQIFDGRGDRVGVASARTVGRDGGSFTIGSASAAPGAAPTVVVTTSDAWIVASIEVDGDADEAAVAQLQNALVLTR